MDLRLDGRLVVVTGGASGIGAAIADKFIECGADVIVLDRNDRPGVKCLSVDLADAASIDRAVNRLPTEVFALVNAAGVSGASPADVVFKVNFLGLRQMCEQVLPRIEDSGAIVNIASGAGALWRERRALLLELIAIDDRDEALGWFESLEMSGVEAYDFSKEAVILLSQALAQRRFLDHSVRVVSVSPGPIETPLLPSFVDTMGADFFSYVKERLGRDGSPQEVASVVAFLSSTEASWVNGTDLAVDGGSEGGFQSGILRQELHPSSVMPTD